MLEACELHGKRANITVFGIIPKDINSVKIGLSESLHVKFEMLIQAVIEEVEGLGVKITRKNNRSLQGIVNELSLGDRVDKKME